MNTYEAIILLIKENPDQVDFGDLRNGISDLWIQKAELRLNCKFPPSYLWWLKNYGGGSILGEEIFSIYEKDFDEVVGGDIVYINELDRRNNFSDNSQLEICQTDRAESFYFDLTNMSKEGEYQVFRSIGDLKEKYADDFLDFLSKRIIEG